MSITFNVVFCEIRRKKIRDCVFIVVKGATVEVQVTFGAMQLHNRCAIFVPSFQGPYVVFKGDIL